MRNLVGNFWLFLCFYIIIIIIIIIIIFPEFYFSSVGPFITKIHIIAPPSPEKFQLAAELYVPGYNVPIEPGDETSDKLREDNEDKNFF